MNDKCFVCVRCVCVQVSSLCNGFTSLVSKGGKRICILYSSKSKDTKKTAYSNSCEYDPVFHTATQLDYGSTSNNNDSGITHYFLDIICNF